MHVDFVLGPVPFNEKVVVTATRTERRLEEVPVRIEVVSRETIERTAARTLAGAIEYTTGVRMPPSSWIGTAVSSAATCAARRSWRWSTG